MTPLLYEIIYRDTQGIYVIQLILYIVYGNGDRHARDRMVIEFTTTCAISAYHH